MLRNIPIFVRDTDGKRYKVGKADATNAGTVVVFFDGHKTSRHPDGNFWSGPVGSGHTRPFELRVHTSEVTAEELCTVPVRSNLTLSATPYSGPKPGFEFSSTALAASNCAFGALHVDGSLLDDAIAGLEAQAAVVSASTYHDTAAGKAVVLYVTHGSS